MRPRLLRLFVVLAAMMLPLVGAAVAQAAEQPQEVKITSTPPAGASVGGTYPVVATATSQKPIEITSEPESVCKVTESKATTTATEATVSLVGKGKCTVKAHQPGEPPNWAAADATPQGFEVKRGTQTITFTSTKPEPARIGTPYNVTATGGASGNPVTFTAEPSNICSVVGAEVSFTAVGKCIVTAKQEESPNYKAAASQPETITVAKAIQTVSFEPPPSALVGSTAPLSATSSSGGGVEFKTTNSSICTVSPSEPRVSFVGVGECLVEAIQPGNATYEQAGVTKPIKVAQATPIISFTSVPPAAATIGGSPYTVTATSTSGEQVVLTIDPTSTSVCSISGAVVSFTGAGTCTVDATQPESANYLPATMVQQSFEVAVSTPHQQTFTPTPTPTLTPTPTPKSTPKPPPPVTFTLASSSVDPKTGRITFSISFDQPGSFSWLFTFPNGKFGVYTAQNAKCASGSIKLNGRCRPAKITFAAGHSAIPGVGRLKVWFKPSTSGMKALKTAMKKGRPVLVSATFTFVPASGLTPVSQTRTFSVKLKKH